MTRCIKLVCATTGVLFAATAVASAAELQLDHGCYLARQGSFRGQSVNFTGTGFTPGAPVTATLDGRTVATGQAGSGGTIVGDVAAPALPANKFFGFSKLIVTDGTNVATTSFRNTKLAADFLPSTGNPRTLQVRFYVYGFGPLLEALNRPIRQRVYEHVISPGGRALTSFAVGFTGGPCGSLATSKHKILPFSNVPNGKYNFVFDTNPRYSTRSSPQAGVGFIVRTIFVRR